MCARAYAHGRQARPCASVRVRAHTRAPVRFRARVGGYPPRGPSRGVPSNARRSQRRGVVTEKNGVVWSMVFVVFVRVRARERLRAWEGVRVREGARVREGGSGEGARSALAHAPTHDRAADDCQRGCIGAVRSDCVVVCTGSLIPAVCS